MAAVDAGKGGGFNHTSDLKVMKFDEAMASKDKKEWIKAVDRELASFDKHNVYKPVKRKDVPKDAKNVSTTWAMKKKASGKYRARCNMRGFEQRDGEHYDSHSISALVTNDVTIRLTFIIMMMALWWGYLIDVNGAFLNGQFQNGEVIYSEIPQGFHHKYNPKHWLWLLLKTCYGLKQASYEFWRQLLEAMKNLLFKRSNADPCLYTKWTDHGLNIWISWVDDLIAIGPKDDIVKNKEQFKNHFECEDVGWLDEYVGCKIDIDRNKRKLKYTQPVLIQSLHDEFDLPEKEYHTPAEPGQVLSQSDEGDILNSKVQTLYRSGVGKLIHLMRWSRPEIYNAVRELTMHLGKCNEVHLKAMKRTMRYCTTTPKRGWQILPKRIWDGIDKDFLFEMIGLPDASFAKCKRTRRSVTGINVLFEGVVLVAKSGMQKIVALSTAEAEVIAIVMCVQEMMYVDKVVTSMGLKVKKPMLVKCDNKGAVDLVNGWAVGGSTKHIDIRLAFLRKLKKSKVICVEWIASGKNTSDLHTKNLDQATFDKHTKVHVGEDEYFAVVDVVDSEARRSVRE